MEKYDGFSGEEGTPAWSATLDDGTDTAQLVVWDEENIPRIYDNRGVIKHDAVRVCGASVGEFNEEVQLTVGDLGTVVGIEQTSEDQSEVTEAQSDDAATTDDTTAAATDGGESDETDATTGADLNQSLIKQATKSIKTEYDSGDEITAPAFAGRQGLSPKQGEAVLEHLTTEKGLLERLEEGYRVL